MSAHAAPSPACINGDQDLIITNKGGHVFGVRAQLGAPLS
jgi:hypothetical protein